jgi:hypothetical protein
LKNRRIKSLLSIVLCVMLVISNIAYADTAKTEIAKYTDIAGNKYETQIREWIANGFIKGYPDGNFKPGNQITRSEFMALVNRSYGFTDTVDIKYSDVNKSNWYYSDASIATKAGFIQGANGKLMPLDNISRQEMAVILSRLTKNEKTAADDAVINNFTDKNEIPAWSKAATSVAMKNKFFDGFVDKVFMPTVKITRLEAVVALDRAFKSMYKGVYASKGIFGPETGMDTIDGDVVVIAPDVTLRNVTINGNLILRETIGEGNVNLDNVVVKGDTIVKGGGANSIVIKDSTLGRIIVIKVGNIVRIVATGSTGIGTVEVGANVKLEEFELTGTGFDDVLILNDIPEGTNVVFVGNFGDVEIDSPNIDVTIQSGTMSSLTLTKTAVDTNINIEQQATVTNMTLDVATNVTGKGAIGTANINVAGTIIEQSPTTVVIAPQIIAQIGGKTVTGSLITIPSPPPPTGGGGGIPPTNSAPVASNVMIEGDAIVGETLVGSYTYSDAENNAEGTSSFKWYRTDLAGGNKIAITGAITRTYTIQSVDKGKFLFFEVTPVASTGTKQGNVALSSALEIAPAEILSNLRGEVAKLNEYGFDIQTIAKSDKNKKVLVKIIVNPNQANDIKLEYYESNDSEFYPLNFDNHGVAWYGPQGGFSLQDGESHFKARFNKTGTYEYELQLIDVSTQEVIALDVGRVEVGLNLDVKGSAKGYVFDVYSKELSTEADTLFGKLFDMTGKVIASDLKFNKVDIEGLTEPWYSAEYWDSLEIGEYKIMLYNDSARTDELIACFLYISPMVHITSNNFGGEINTSKVTITGFISNYDKTQTNLLECIVNRGIPSIITIGDNGSFSFEIDLQLGINNTNLNYDFVYVGKPRGEYNIGTSIRYIEPTPFNTISNTLEAIFQVNE